MACLNSMEMEARGKFMMKMMMMGSDQCRKDMFAMVPEDKKEKFKAHMMEMMKKCMPAKVMKEGWSRELPPNHMVCKYVIEYFTMPARSTWPLTCIAAAKCWVKMKMNKDIEVEIRQNTFDDWATRKGTTPHGFMPLMKEFIKCPFTGEMKESEWMDETMDLCWRVIKNAGMVPCEKDLATFGKSSLSDVCMMIDGYARKIYGCFDGELTALMDKERGLASGPKTTMDQKAEFSAEVFCKDDKLKNQLATLKDLFAT